MLVYIDNDCKCHIENDGSMRAVEDGFFDGKCAAFVEGHIFIPEGESVFFNDKIASGKAVFAWQPIDLLNAAQAAYEDVLNSADAAYREGVDSI